jgi:ribosomal protein S18 acetylase RimI-like enzyme
MKDRDLADAIDRNYVAAFMTVVRHSIEPVASSRRFGAIRAIATGYVSAFYNPVIALSPASRSEDLSAAWTWLTDLSRRGSINLRGDARQDVFNTVGELGLVAASAPDPGMALTPIPAPFATPIGLRIEAVTIDALDAWQRLFAGAFGGGSDEALSLARRVFPPSLLDDGGSRLLAGYVADRLVATAWAVRAGDTVGVYAVGTDETVRRRGYGTAMTWACLEAGRRWGCRIAVLQSSELGVGLYTRIGFRAVSSYIVYTPSAETPKPETTGGWHDRGRALTG